MKKTFRIIAIAIATIAAQPALSAGFTNYAENALVDHIFRGQSSAVPSTWYVGLDTGSCTEAGGGTEVTGGSYARVAVTASLANFAGTQSAGSTTASTGTGGTTSNNNAITFPAPTANWGSIVSYRVWDAASSGNAWICATLTTPKTVNNGDSAPSFSAGSLTITID